METVSGMVSTYTRAVVIAAEPQVVRQRLFTPSKPIIANIARPENMVSPIW